jgi:sugar lactone lactonase YvrE
MNRKIPTFFLVLSLLLSTCAPRQARYYAEEEGLQNDIFVSSRNDNSVKHYDGNTGDFLGDFVSPEENGLEATQEVAFGPDGQLYVSGRSNPAVMRYDARSGVFLGAFTKGYTLDNPTKISFGPDGYLYVSQWGERQSSVVRFDAGTGQLVDEFTENLNQPLDHAWDRRGNFYVTCFGSKEVRKYDERGRFRERLPGSDELNGPTNLWFGDDRDLYVADWPTGRILRFGGGSGRFEEVFISGLKRVEGVAMGPDGRLYICDWQANIVQRFDARSGALIDTFIDGGDLQQPNGIVFRPRNR